MKQDLVRILRDIFTSAGYDVSDSYKHDIVAERDGYRTFIKFSSHPDIVEIRNFANQVTDGQGLYVATGDIDSKLVMDAENIGLKVWGRDDMALQIGRAVLADIEGSAGELDLFESPSPKSGSKVDAVAQEAINAIFGTGSSDMVSIPEEPSFVEKLCESPQAESVSSPAQAPPEPRIFQSEAEQLPVTEAPVTQNGTILNIRAAPVRVTMEHAISVAKPHIYTYQDAVLKLVPFWRYDYSLSTEHRYRSKIVDISGEASGCLNALNGTDEQLVLDDVRDSIVVPDVLYEVKHPITTEKEARDQLIGRIVEDHTKDLRFDNTQGEAIISEHKRFRPALEDIRLDIDLVYVPVWEIKGPRSSVEINAYNSEVLQNPVDDDAEFV